MQRYRGQKKVYKGFSWTLPTALRSGDGVGSNAPFGPENHRPHSGAPARSAETQRGQQVLGCARVTGWLADLEGSKLFEHRDFGRMGSKRSPV